MLPADLGGLLDNVWRLTEGASRSAPAVTRRASNREIEGIARRAGMRFSYRRFCDPRDRPGLQHNAS